MLSSQATREPAMDDSPTDPLSGRLIKGDAGTELSASRTSLAFERTRMGSDRTLMATLRTSLSLISFGFTIYQILGKASGVLPRASETARNVGLSLLVLGLVVLAMGIVSHSTFDRELARRRTRLYEEQLLHQAPQYRMTPTYISAVALLVIGLATLGSILLRMVG
jgi:putative membrane protein